MSGGTLVHAWLEIKKTRIGKFCCDGVLGEQF